MKVIPLPDLTKAKFGFTHKVIVDFTDLNTTAGLTKNLDIPAAPATTKMPIGTLLANVAVVPEVTFVGAGITGLTVTVGDEVMADRLLKTGIFTPGTGLVPVFSRSADAPWVLAAPSVLRITVTAVGANLTALTAGKFALYYSAADLNELKVIA